jgi:asparagine synthase (glutamine-hydrolysing)
MCGIAGIVKPGVFKPREESRAELAAALQRMADSLQHRGPDGTGTWVSENGLAGLCHRRLAVIDLSPAGAQPMTLAPGAVLFGENAIHYSIVYNGEIYNYVELREELREKGYQFQTASDTEVILAAYDHYGDECVDHFDGMFAFAIWDHEIQELFAARDRFGEKPFYYSLADGTFSFASEMKALWASGTSRKPNLRMLFNFITIGYTDNPGQPGETFFENIFKLPAGSLLRYVGTTKELTIEKYYEIDPSIQNKKISDAEAIEQFHSLFSTSVRRRLRSDVPIGTSLSGGIDSSAVIATAIEQGKSQVNGLASFTAIFPGYDKDESSYAKQVVDKFGLSAYSTPVTVDDLVNDWEKFIHHQEEPFASASAYAQFKVFQLAKEQGVKVLLDGQGADEMLAGYSKYYKWYWQELFQKRKLVRSGELKAARKLGVEEKFGFKNIIAALAPDIASVILERQYLLSALRQEDLSREFVRLQSREAYYSSPANFNLNGVLYFNTCIHGLEELLRHADRNSMAHGREVRLPFLHHELVEFVFSLPSHFKIRQAWTKWILRQSMSQRLPDEVVWRKKKVGFEPPQVQWMQDKRLDGLIQDARKKLVDEKILKPGILNRPVQAHPANAADGYDWRYLSAAAFL